MKSKQHKAIEELISHLESEIKRLNVIMSYSGVPTFEGRAVAIYPEGSRDRCMSVLSTLKSIVSLSETTESDK